MPQTIIYNIYYIRVYCIDYSSSTNRFGVTIVLPGARDLAGGVSLAY